MKTKIIQFKNITMKFKDVIANNNVSFDIEENEIHALLGENGAGKSTLMSVLFGLYNQTEGDIIIRGKKEKIKTPKDATKHGIAMLPQHFKLVNDMSVWENIILGREKTHGKVLVNKRASIKKLEETMKKYKINIDLKKKVSKLSTSDKQKVELLKMLWIDNDILIFDEPTSILTPQQIEQFLKMLKDLKKAGKTILLITHKLEEIRQVADRCTILRKGKYIKTLKGSTASSQLAKLMVGQSVDLNMGSIKRNKVGIDRSIIEFKDINSKGRTNASSLKSINFNVKSGEILGIAAIDGNGQSEIFQILSGLKNPKNGELFIDGRKINKLNINKRYFDSTKNIMGHIPEDRHEHGLLLDKTLRMNSVLQDINNYKKTIFGIIDNKKIEEHYKKLEKEFDIRGSKNKKTTARKLSGGNQQKLIVAREMSRKPLALLAVHPTRGLDMGAIRNIYTQIINLRNEGSGVLLYSGELDEIIQVSDRIIVLNNGKIVGEFNNKKEFNKNKIGLLMLNKASKERKKNAK